MTAAPDRGADLVADRAAFDWSGTAGLNETKYMALANWFGRAASRA